MTTYIKAVRQVRVKIKEWVPCSVDVLSYLFYTQSASPTKVHLYSFNIPMNQLGKAVAFLDKENGRGAMMLVGVLHISSF